MPDISRVTGPWSDGDVLTSEQLTKDVYQGGRVVGFDGTKGGAEVLNGQLDVDDNFDSATSEITLTPRQVRRGSFTLGPFVSGFRQSRDLHYSVFPDLDVTAVPEAYQRGRVVLGKTWENRTDVTSYWVDVAVDYTVATSQADSDVPSTVSGTFKGFMALWLDGTFYPPSATPTHEGRASTVRPTTGVAYQYNNTGPAPDFRRYAMRFRISAADLVTYGLPTDFLDAGWHDIDFRVTSGQTHRIHGGAITVVPVV